MQTWKTSRIWKQLAKSKRVEAAEVRALLELRMPEIQAVLSSGGSSPKDFTLHDAEHSLRVVHRMAEIIPGDVLVKLSDYELALLLLSAYVHDIGMTPEQDRVQRHWRHLLFGSVPGATEGLMEVETVVFQRWLDDRYTGIVPPLSKDGQASESDLRVASELVTYYARDRHNDWSEVWIRNYLSRDRLGSYEGWVDDLVRICRSHHEGYEQLVGKVFDPRPAGRVGNIVHLRYLACVLRIADILDVDPERSPEILFHHRSIAPESILYWFKDHNLWIKSDGGTLVVHARPKTALIEKAVRLTADGIRQELEICARLSREKPFSHSPLWASTVLPHRWDFPESVLLDVRAQDDTYVYIDGAFRPNTKKLLELFSGLKLYKEPFAAVRELLQNALDAVKEEMAVQRLSWSDPNDSIRLEALSTLHRVEVRLEARNGRTWLVCTDTGIGMTRRIIENFLLVSGNSRRRETLELERRCRAAGFNLGRSGQFGIGVLSYFMIADQVEITTRRSSAQNDSEAHGWKFETEGVGSFGELKMDLTHPPGSTVSLRIRNDFVLLASHLADYIKSILLRLPCSFYLFSGSDRECLLHCEAGWRRSENEALQRLLSKAPDNYKERLEEWKQIAQGFTQAIRWELEIGELPGGLGCYRLCVPYFELPGGRCASYLDLAPVSSGKVFDNPRTIGLSSLSGFNNSPSYCGLSIENSAPQSSWWLWGCNFFIDIDWESERAGSVSVDRMEFVWSSGTDTIVSWLRTRCYEIQGRVLSSEASQYSELNAMVNPVLTLPEDPWWYSGFGNEATWAPVAFPAVRIQDLALLDLKFTSLEWQGLSVSLLRDIHRGERPSFPRMCAAVAGTNPLLLVPLALGSSGSGQRRHYGNIELVSFPPSWETLCGVQLEHDSDLLNLRHPLVQKISGKDLFDYRHGISRRHAMEEALASQSLAAMVIIVLLANASREELASYYRALWEAAFLGGEPPESLVYWKQKDGKWGTLHIVRSDGSFVYVKPYEKDIFSQHLPDPGQEWRLVLGSQ